jgi:hypothetical protein
MESLRSRPANRAGPGPGLTVIRAFGWVAAVRQYVEYLAARGMRGERGLDKGAIKDLEKALRTRLPAPVRELYALCGGLRSKRWTDMPMRLMLPREVIEDETTLRDAPDVYWPSPEARYLFTDDGSNWAGVFVEGPLTGKVTILQHDLQSAAPLFRDLSSFLDKLIDAARRDLDWPDMETDYPFSPDSDASLVHEAEALAPVYLQRYRAATNARETVHAAQAAGHLAPPTELSIVRELLRSSNPRVRFIALVVATRHRQPALTADLFDYAKAAQVQDDYGHWLQACRALDALDAHAELDILESTAKRNWPRVRGGGRRRRT